MEKTARETLAIIERGYYETASGVRVDLADSVRKAVAGTALYRPAELEALVERMAPRDGQPTRYSVANETTQTAARRMAAASEVGGVVVLNFASAKSPGGGFLNGAKAQEEDLCRCSALYPCLVPQTEYYEVNRALRSAIYTDHMIYSPTVPFFRETRHDLLDSPFNVAVITSPAPNARAFRDRTAAITGEIESALKRRIGHILAVASARGHRELILGAWGCGAFRNQPRVVAALFAHWLAEPRFAGHFDAVHFPVLDRTPELANFNAFCAHFAS